MFSILDVYIKFLSPHHSPFLTKPAPWKAPQACEVEPETDGSTAGPLEDSQAESFEGFHVEPNEGGEEWAGDGGEEWAGDGGEEEGTWGDGQPMMYPSESHPSVEGDADGSLVAGESEQPHLEAVSHIDGLSDDDVEFISATAATSNAAEDIGEDQQKIQEELQRLQNLLVEAESLEAELETLRPIISRKNVDLISKQSKRLNRNHSMPYWNSRSPFAMGAKQGSAYMTAIGRLDYLFVSLPLNWPSWYLNSGHQN